MEKINLSERSCKMQPLGEVLTRIVQSMDDDRQNNAPGSTESRVVLAKEAETLCGEENN